MKSLTTLFATNFSPSAKTAVEASNPLLKAFRSNTHLIHVIASFWKDWFSSGLCRKEAYQRLASWQQELLNEQDDTKLHVEQGNASEAILKTAQDIHADLILLGSKSSEKDSRYQSSVTLEAVVRSAKQPVMIFKDKAITKILCAIDISDHSHKTLAWAIELAKILSCQLTIISVLPRIDFNPLGMDEKEVEQHEEKFKEAQTTNIEQFLSSFDFSGISIEKRVPWGIPSHVILDIAEDLDQDLIVIGAKGHSMLESVLIGSTAEKILRHAPCSLLVVR